MFKRILIAASLLAASAPAFPQAGQFPSGFVQGNATASAGQSKPSAVTAILDRALGSTRGAILERGSSGWGIVGPGATAGLAWISGGTGVDPSYAALGISGGGTGCISASGTCLDNITGFSSTTGYLTRTGPGSYSFSFPAFSQVTGSAACSQLPAMTGVVTTTAGSCAHAYPSANANTVLSNWTGPAAAPIFNVWPACANDGAHALVYINGTGLQCGVLTTGGTVTSVIPGAGLVSSVAASCSQSAFTTSGTLSTSECVNAQSGTSYAILDGDRAKLITTSNASAQAYTIAQAGAASAFVAGWYSDIQNNSTIGSVGAVTLTPTTSTINGLTSLKIYPGVSGRLVSDGSNYRFIFSTAPGEWTLLASLTGTTISDTADITATYNHYWIHVNNCIPATATATIFFQVHASAAFQNTSYIGSISESTAGGAPAGASPTTGVQLGTATSTSADPGLGGDISFDLPAAAQRKRINFSNAGQATSGGDAVIISTGYWNATTAIDGFQIIPSTGAFTSCRADLYGRL